MFVRERNSGEDLTGWGSIEFILNNGEIFVISGEQFGQGSDEDGLWVDMNKLKDTTLLKIKQKVCKLQKEEKEETISAWLKHQNM